MKYFYTKFLHVQPYELSVSECQPGYHGPNCAKSCPYPTYGDRCQGVCDCDKISCDVSTGCRTPTTGYYHLTINDFET